MAELLVLTKNVENELLFFDQLRHVGHEVFLSQNVLTYWEQKKSLPYWVSGFQLIILSETIPNRILKELLTTAKKNEQTYVLKVDLQPSLEQRRSWSDMGVERWISAQAPLSELSNLLEQAETKKSSISSDSCAGLKDPIGSFRVFQTLLSDVNQQIVEILAKRNGASVGREELSNLLWKKSTPATLSQLSFRIKKINELIARHLGIERAIATDWGKGYRLREVFIDAYLEEIEFI